MRSLITAILLIVCLARPLQAAPAAAGIELPAGRRLLDMRFSDSQSIVLLQEERGEIVLSRLSVDGTLRDMEIPRSLQRSAGPEGRFTYVLAPLGNALAVVERNESLVKASRLSVYGIGEEHVTDLPAWQMPEDFWPDSLCWDEAGENVFVAARPYLKPQQTVSVGVYQLAAAKFTALLKRSEVDLVRQLAFLPGSGELAVLCSCYEGAYPADDLVLLVNPDGNRTRIVHGQASHGELQLLDDGDLLLRCGGQHDQQDWLLAAGRSGFGKIDGDALPGWGCQVSRDGRWFARLAGKAASAELELSSAAGLALTTGMDSSLWRLNHDGTYLCSLDRAGRELFFFALDSEN